MAKTIKKPKSPSRLSQTKKRAVPRRKDSGRTPVKGYWFYVALVLVVGVGLLINQQWAARAHNVLGDATNLSANGLLTYTNSDRSQNHEPPLTLNPNLMAAAQTKANDMVSRNYWAHNTPDGTPPWSFMTQAGYYYDSAGENLAYGFVSAQAVLSGWMNSTEHRANVLGASYKDVGFGIVNAPNYQGHGPQTVVVAMYGQPATTAAVASASSQNQLGTTIASTSAPTSQTLSRLQVLAANNSGLLALGVVSLTSLLCGLLIAKHVLKLRRVLVYSEEFVLHHPLVDIGLMLIIMAGFLISRTAGYIG